MNILIAGIVVGAVLGYGAVLVNSLGKMPSGRPNYEEKELTDTFMDYKAPKTGRAFFIQGDGRIKQRKNIVRHDLCGC
jgi:hypothetical protein